MNAELIAGVLGLAQLLLALGMALALVRLLRGPRAEDRVLALDTLYLNAMLLVITSGVVIGSRVMIEVALVVALLGFVSSAAAAKFLLRGEVIE
jgi:multicomponent K+:H+ antiporter subunit F